ncbi:MAG TPA: TonB C-terminal domain-containing protein [Geopsychrobacteraceae bacterium]|nr:TonB C-terminal domain-containing protein [Geopsychrobacteraceae bacterium]
MKLPKKQSWRQLHSRLEPGFKRMLWLSVAIHFLFPILYTGLLHFTPEKAKPPVYRVNLVNKPVKNPQAGRPEASPKQETKTVKKAKPKPVVRPTPKPKPVVKPKPKPSPKPEPKSKPVVKPTPKPKPEPTISKADEQSFDQKMAELRRQQEREDRLAALRAELERERRKVVSPVEDAPVGEITGKGDQEGIAYASYVKEFITERWRLSKYQLPSLNLEAEWKLIYNAQGKLIHKKVISKSGNKAFDDSLLTAIMKSQNLGRELEEQTEFEVTFNLREMQN